MPISPGKSSQLAAFFQIAWFETKSILKNQTFIILVAIGLINLIASLSSFTEQYGSSKYPVTYDVIEIIYGAFFLFLIAIITFYSGVLVWLKSRKSRIPLRFRQASFLVANCWP